MRTLSTVDAFKQRATYEDGSRVKPVPQVDPNADLKAIVAQLKDLVTKISQLAQANTSNTNAQSAHVLDLIQNQNQVIQSAIQAFAEREDPVQEPLNCVFRVLSRDRNGKVLTFEVKET